MTEQAVRPTIVDWATPQFIKKSKLPTKKNKLKLRGLFRGLLTPPTSPSDITVPQQPRPLRMPDENKQLLQFCTVCASNNNRSMEAHRVLKENGFNVASFGTGSQVRMPGPRIDQPAVYDFGTPYDTMFKELLSRDRKLYTANGVLQMLDRNRNIKDHPQSWSTHDRVFDVVFTCQERCFDGVCLDLMHKGVKLNRPCHVINIEIEDNHQEAIVGGVAILDLARSICDSTDPDAEMVNILTEWQKKHPKLPSMYQLCYV